MDALVIGNADVDETFVLARLPRPGETVLARELRKDPGGKGANQALVLGRCGFDVRLVSRIGNDADGAWLRDRLLAAGLDVSGLIRCAAPTDRSVVWLESTGENVIVSTAECAEAVSPQDALAALHDASAGALLVMQGNLSVETTGAALRHARDFGLATVFNPAPVRAGFNALWPFVDLAVLNEEEAAALAGTADPVAAAGKLRGQGAGEVVVTLGRRGAFFMSLEESLHVAANPVRVVDTTGAGDTFTAVLAAARLARHADVRQALEAASRAAAITVGSYGTFSAFPDAEAMANILADALTRPR